MIEVKKLEADVWVAAFSEYAHQGVFGELKPRNLDRIDYALLAIKDESPLGYMTCREMDANTVYWQYGGMFEPFRKSILCMRVYEGFRDFHMKSYKRCLTYIENINISMLKMAWKIGFRIIGVRNYQGSILLEHLLEFGGENGNKIDIC